MPRTPVRKTRFPTLTGAEGTPPDVPRDLERLAVDLDDAPRSAQGALSGRPVQSTATPGDVGLLFKSTDEASTALRPRTRRLYHSHGQGYDEIPLLPIGAADIEQGTVKLTSLAENIMPNAAAGWVVTWNAEQGYEHHVFYQGSLNVSAAASDQVLTLQRSEVTVAAVVKKFHVANDPQYLGVGHWAAGRISGAQAMSVKHNGGLAILDHCRMSMWVLSLPAAV